MFKGTMTKRPLHKKHVKQIYLKQTIFVLFIDVFIDILHLYK